MFGLEKNHTTAANTLLSGEDLYIGIVQARFNSNVTEALRDACVEELLRLGVAEKHIKIVSVPGALEIPIALQALANATEFDALVAIGCVIRGETYHFELVANESAAGVTRVALDTRTPIVNAVLTTENLAQAVARQTVKGQEAAQAAVEMANLVGEL